MTKTSDVWSFREITAPRVRRKNLRKAEFGCYLYIGVDEVGDKSHLDSPGREGLILIVKQLSQRLQSHLGTVLSASHSDTFLQLQ